MRQDVINAIRSLRKSPTFTGVALVVLALGIAAATALFSVVDAVVLRGLPFDTHDRLVAVLEFDTTRPVTFGGGTTTPQTFLDWQQQQQSFEGLTAVGSTTYRLRNESGEPAAASASRVTWEFFPLLRVAPLAGRPFTADDEVQGRHRVVILSYGFWQRRFGGAADVIGKTIDLNEEPWDIVGVMPADFSYPVASQRPSELFTPVAFTSEERVRAKSRNYNWTTIGRLKNGITVPQAHDQMNRLMDALDRDRVVVGVVGDIRHLGPETPVRQECYITYAQTTASGGTVVVRTAGDPLALLPAAKTAVWAINPEQRFTGDVFTMEGYMDRLIAQRRFNMAMLVLFGVLALVITAAGIYGVMAYLVEQRTNEIGLRMALGATPGSVVSMVLRRASVLIVIGLAVGAAVAWSLSSSVQAFLFETKSSDARIFALALAVLTISGLVASGVPARRAAHVDPLVALRQE
jgi:hypothetical protein